MGLLISINSNGTLIDESVVRWLKETPPVRINITYMAPRTKPMAASAGIPRATQVTRAIRLLGEAGITVKLNCSLTPTMQRTWRDFLPLPREEGLLVQATSYMFPSAGTPARWAATASPPGGGLLRRRIESLLNGAEAFLERLKSQSWEDFAPDPGEDCRNPWRGGHPVPRRKSAASG